MPQMSPEHGSYYPGAIKKQAAGRAVRRVLFDVRGNGGGGDSAWRRAPSAVIARPIRYPTRVVCPPRFG